MTGDQEQEAISAALQELEEIQVEIPLKGNPGTRAMNESGAAKLAREMQTETAIGVVVLLVGERHKGESKKAMLACNDFLRMGPGRELSRLRRGYVAQNIQDPTYRPPTTAKGTLGLWSSRWGWVDRAARYDAEVDAGKTARREELLSSGLALVEERLAKLIDLADLLEEELFARAANGDLPGLWVQDVKQIGSGKMVQRVDIVRFNAGIVQQYRGTLDDLAAEMGHRVRGVDLTTKGERLGGRLTDAERAAEVDRLLESTEEGEA